MTATRSPRRPRILAVLALAGLAFGASVAPAHAAPEPYQGVALTISGRYHPDKTVFDDAGNAYILAVVQHETRGESAVVLRRSKSGTLTRVAGDATRQGITKPDKAINAKFRGIDDIALDSRGNLYIADCVSRVVTKVSPKGRLTIVAGQVGKSGKPKPGKATSTRLKCPTILAVDAERNVFIGDWALSAVMKVTPSGTLSIVTGQPGKPGFPTAGPARQSRLGNPAGLAVDTKGNLYIADAAPYCLIEKVTPEGELSIVAGRGGYGVPKPGRLATKTFLGIPSSVAVDKDGNLFVGMSNSLYAKRQLAVVGKIGGDGVLRVVAGRIGKRGKPTPGPATKSKLDFGPTVSVDRSGKVYAALSVAFGSKGSYVVRITKKGRLSIVERMFTLR